MMFFSHRLHTEGEKHQDNRNKANSINVTVRFNLEVAIFAKTKCLDGDVTVGGYISPCLIKPQAEALN